MIKITIIPRHIIKKHLSLNASKLGVTTQFVRAFIRQTWHKSRHVGLAVVETTIGFLHNSQPVYTWTTTSHKFTNSVEAYMNFMQHFKKNVFDNPIFYQDLTAECPRYIAPTYKGGRVYVQPGLQAKIPSISRSKPPPFDDVMQNVMATSFKKIMPENWDEASREWAHSNIQPNDEMPYQNLFAGSPLLKSAVRVPKPKNAKEAFAFLKSRPAIWTLAHCSAGVAQSYDESHKKQVVPIVTLGSEKVIDKIMTMPVARGQATYNCADKRMGNTQGTKKQQAYFPKSVITSLIRAFKGVLEADVYLTAKVVQPISYWASLINKFFVDCTWKYFFNLYVNLFRKAETIPVGKTPRIIWGVDMLNILIDYILKKPFMNTLKNQNERGFTTGSTAKGAGFTYMHYRIVNFYLAQLKTSAHKGTRELLCQFFGLKDDATDEQLAGPLQATLVGKDDDVGAWDFCQYTVNFEVINLIYLYRADFNPRAVTVDQAIFLMLMCYSSHMRATTTVNIRKAGENKDQNCVVQNLPSGYLGTAIEGSQLHSFIQHEAQSYKYLIASSLHRNYVPKTKLTDLVFRLAKLGTPACHASDDFIDLTINLATIVHSLFDDQFHYAQVNLVLKHEKTNVVRELPKSFTWPGLLAAVDPDLVQICGLDLGTFEGIPYNNGCLLKDVLLYDSQKRFTCSYKPFFSTYDENDVRITDGVTFLRWNFRLWDDDWFIVTRDPVRLIAKLMRMSTNILTPSQWVMRLRAYMYLSVGNKRLYDCISDTEDLYRSQTKLTNAVIADEFNKEPVKEIVNLMSFKLEGLTGEHLRDKPSYQNVLEFYGPAADTTAGTIRSRHLASIKLTKASDEHLITPGDRFSDHPVLVKPVVVPQSTRNRLDELRRKCRVV